MFPRFGYSVFAVLRVNEEAEDVNRSYNLVVELTVACATYGETLQSVAS